MIDRAGQGGSSKLNFVITHFFVDQNRDYIPEYWCYKPTMSPECVPVTQVGYTCCNQLPLYAS
jgi:hypothetical protein